MGILTTSKAPLYDVQLHVNGVATANLGHMTMSEIVNVNALNAAKNTGRVWKLYTVTNPFTGV